MVRQSLSTVKFGCIELELQTVFLRGDMMVRKQGTDGKGLGESHPTNLARAVAS
jgi:hypothetical protein